VLLFAVSIHESAHGWMAEKFGDPTARMQGRITLNPIPHIDLVGSIIFPIFLYLMGSSAIFGWAKPVIWNPYNVRNYRRANIFISAAGPGSNIISGFVGTVVFLILKRFGLVDPIPLFFASEAKPGLLTIIISSFILTNIFLAIFNMIPVPPLDGSGIVEGLLHGDALYNYQKLKPYGFIILILILYTGVLNIIARPILILVANILIRG